MDTRVLAIDFGASGGRGIIGEEKNGEIVLTEIHRFENVPVSVNGTLHWDILRLFHEVKQCLKKASPYGISSVGIDTWGVDFGLLRKGKLLSDPVHYRDTRTAHKSDDERLITKKELYRATGTQIMDINSIYRLLCLKEDDPELFAMADTMLMIPDLLCYMLTGDIHAECSIASTTGLFDPYRRDWAWDVIDRLGLPRRLFPPVTEPGTVCGMIRDDICKELNIEPVPVTAVCGHDTQSAMAAVPAEEEDFAFLSSGTWSLLGTQSPEPLICDGAESIITNEAAFRGKTAFLKNLTGLWLLQESRRYFAAHGREYSFAQMEEMARATPFCGVVDTEDGGLSLPGDIPGRIKGLCVQEGLAEPATDAQIIRIIYDSLAHKYKTALQELSAYTGKKYSRLYIIGGGVRDKFLSELTARVCGIEVITGSPEATALGNAKIQLESLKTNREETYA
ncbi:MAG: rhamnulokinase [Oscillospiraceae bacterium]|nr:rhamnulokinase [Oscillospiraceae bacterium]